MKNAKMIFRSLQDALSLGSAGKCGLDDEELMAVTERLDVIDCGMEDDELRKAVEQFKALPIEKRAEIAYALTEHKMYEESICRKYGITRATMYRWMAKGKLPKEFHRDGAGRQFIYEHECDETMSEWSASHTE